ncbi:MAG: hypothetical protein V7K71_16000 [Nostoc sp.]
MSSFDLVAMSELVRPLPPRVVETSDATSLRARFLGKAPLISGDVY